MDADCFTLVEEVDKLALMRLRANGGLSDRERRDLLSYVGSIIPHQGVLGVPVIYTRPTRLGRLVPCRAGGSLRDWNMCYMLREYRACAAASLYHDIDMFCAQPMLLVQLLQRHGIPAPALQTYIEQRWCVAAV